MQTDVNTKKFASIYTTNILLLYLIFFFVFFDFLPTDKIAIIKINRNIVINSNDNMMQCCA